ncbi:hypothetical protein H4R19_002214, partial [Coemansia spiralis]
MGHPHEIPAPSAASSSQPDLAKHAQIEGCEATSEAERQLIKSYLRKSDLRLLPATFAMYFLAVIDRNNIGNAKVAGMDKHLGL